MKLKLTLVVLLLSSVILSVVVNDVRAEEEDDEEVEVEEEEEEEVIEETEQEVEMPPSHVEYEILKEAKKEKCRARVTNDNTAGIHFVGKLASDGSVFFDSRANNEKDDWIYIPLGIGESIKGLELGMFGMCVDEIRRIVVEPEWIKNGRNKFDPKEGVVPRDQKLIFEVEVMHIAPNYIKGLPNMFKVYDTDKDEYLTVDEIAAYLIEGGQFGPAGPLIDKLAKEVIDRDDSDKDGKVQWKEFSGPKHDEL